LANLSPETIQARTMAVMNSAFNASLNLD